MNIGAWYNEGSFIEIWRDGIVGGVACKRISTPKVSLWGETEMLSMADQKLTLQPRRLLNGLGHCEWMGN